MDEFEGLVEDTQPERTYYVAENYFEVFEKIKKSPYFNKDRIDVLYSFASHAANLFPFIKEVYNMFFVAGIHYALNYRNKIEILSAKEYAEKIIKYENEKNEEAMKQMLSMYPEVKKDENIGYI